MADEDIPAYVARCLCGCGALKFASVDEPNQSKERRASNAKEIAALLRKGYTIERMTVGDVRKSNWKCSGSSITASQE